MKALLGVRNAIYVLLLYTLSAQSKLVLRISKFKNSNSDLFLHNISTVKGVRVIFLGSEPSDTFIQNIMSLGTSVILEINIQRDSISGLTSHDCKKDIILDFLAVVGPENNLLNCTHLVVQEKCLASERNFFIYKIENTHSTTSGKGRYLCLHTSVDLLSRNLSDCYMEQRSPPPSHYNCTFPPSGNFRRDYSEHGSRRWPDMMGKMVEVVTFHRPIATIIHQDESDPTKRYDGLEMKIFMEIAKTLNMTWRVNELEGELDKWGQLLNGSWRGGIMEALTLGTAEIGFSTLWMSPIQIPYLDYTTSWTIISSTFLVPRPTLIGISWESLVRPFTLPLWEAVAFSFFLFPIVAWTTARLHLLITQENISAKKKNSNLDSYIMYTLGSVTGGSGELSKANELPVRFLVSWWYIFILLLCNSYNSKIMACLTLPSYTPKINTVQQLVEQRFSWGRPYLEDNLFQNLDSEKYWHRQFAKHFIVYNETHLTKMLMSKRFVPLAQQIESCDHIFMDHPIEDGIAGNFRVMKEKIKSYRSAIAFRKHSPLLPIFNSVLGRLIETGLVQFFKEDAVRRFQRPAYKRILVEIDDGILSTGIAPLTLENYKFMFYLYFIGMLISTGCFLKELCLQRVVTV